MNPRTPLHAASAFALATAPFAAPASAQVAASLVETGTAVTIDGEARTIDALETFNVNNVGGYALTAESVVALDDPETPNSEQRSVDYVYGSRLGEDGAVQYQRGPSVESFAIGADVSDTGSFLYRTNNNGISAIVRDGTALLAENQPVAAPSINGRYNVPNGPRTTADASSFSFASSLRTTSGAGAGNAVFGSAGAVAIGQFINNSAAGSSTVTSEGALQGTITGYAVSDDGVSFLGRGDVSGNPAVDDVVLTGSLTEEFDVLRVNGGAVRQGTAVVGGTAGDVYNTFSAFAVGNDGTRLFTGTLNGGDDAYLNLDGDFVLRTGDGVGGGTLDGAFTTAALNNTGDYATISTIDGLATLIVNGEAFLELGDQVRTSAGLEELTGLTAGGDTLGLTDGVDGVFDVYFKGSTASVSEALFSVTVPEPGTAALLVAGAAVLGRRRRA